MLKQERRKGKPKVWYWTIVAVMLAVLLCIQPTFAAETENIWDRFSTIMRDFYGKIVAISTIVAVTMAAVALAMAVSAVVVMSNCSCPAFFESCAMSC